MSNSHLCNYTLTKYSSWIPTDVIFTPVQLLKNTPITPSSTPAKPFGMVHPPRSELTSKMLPTTCLSKPLKSMWVWILGAEKRRSFIHITPPRSRRLERHHHGLTWLLHYCMYDSEPEQFIFLFATDIVVLISHHKDQSTSSDSISSSIPFLRTSEPYDTARRDSFVCMTCALYIR